MSDVFAIATRDELFLDGTLVESRLEYGTAVTSGTSIVCRDVADPELLERVESRGVFGIPGRVRVVISARRTTTTIDDVYLSIEHALVTTPAHAHEDIRLLRAPGVVAPPSLPILWRNGSAAVLLHEAVGHAAEWSAGVPPAPREAGETPALRWPTWLSVRDEPHFPVDDRGAPTRPADLLREPPHAFRRATFRDVPRRRMTTLVARGSAPFEIPAKRIEVQLVRGGRYEPLTGEVTLFVLQSQDENGQPFAPFTIRATREAIARALVGAQGEPERYPGVVCSSEGQPLVVGSYAPVMLTAELT